ncbi:homeobox protein Hox-A9a-like [Rhopalosiphum padi]|uniref:homeobox protein Hox-A9a-like n=1 Tax=Rhopalosiphum padi TaxID=40932 RepID=UPI00298DA176|nr:homeobox protein Hox-A9a-like [Rhopalosiphum padi]
MVPHRELDSNEDKRAFYGNSVLFSVVFTKSSTSDEGYNSDSSSKFSGSNNSPSAYILRPPWLQSTANNVVQSFRKNRMPPIFNNQQIIQLEESYLDNQYLTMRAQINLARKLRINEDNIKLWFRKRRLIDFLEVDNYDSCLTTSDALQHLCMLQQKSSHLQGLRVQC